MSPGHTHTLSSYVFSGNFVLLEPGRGEMVDSQMLAPSQPSEGLVSTVGCADGELPANSVPKAPREAGRCFPSPDTVLESLLLAVTLERWAG